MSVFLNRKSRTKLPNGKKPRYKDLEASFLKVWKKLEVAELEIKRLNEENASLRYEAKITKGEDEAKDNIS